MINLPSHKALLEKNVQKDLNRNTMEIELERFETEEKKSNQDESPAQNDVLNYIIFNI